MLKVILLSLFLFAQWVDDAGAYRAENQPVMEGYVGSMLVCANRKEALEVYEYGVGFGSFAAMGLADMYTCSVRRVLVPTAVLDSCEIHVIRAVCGQFPIRSQWGISYGVILPQAHIQDTRW